MNLAKLRKIFLGLSIVLVILSVTSILYFGLNLAVDFTGGSLVRYQISGSDTNLQSGEQEILEAFNAEGVEVLEVSQSENEIVVRTATLNAQVNNQIKTQIESNGDISQVSFETIGPTIGRETTRKAFFAVGIASLAIVLYIAYAFKNIPSPYSSFKFGLSAIAAMLHDALIVLGVFAVLGAVSDVQIDALFITAVLTVIGFSVHDSIVVFDRIRENLNKFPKSVSFEEVADYSLIETLNRSLATSLTVLITLFALFLLGGVSIKYFVLALLIGIFAGTYSSIFVATPLLVLWESSSFKSIKLKRKK